LNSWGITRDEGAAQGLLWERVEVTVNPPLHAQSLTSTAQPGVAPRTREPSSVEAIFVADSVDDAVNLAKRALGSEALIVSSRRIEREGRKPRFEIRAATGEVDPTIARELREDPPGLLLDAPRATTLLERLLRDNDVPAEDARDLALQERRASRSLADVRSAMIRILRERVGWGDRTASARVVAVVGPTGVGKTTTIAKLAARDALVHGRRVALISADDYRLGGADQLARFAELMDVPFAVASDPASLVAALSRFMLADRIYIDTAGRSPRSPGAHAQLAAMLSSAGAATLLCISAATRSQELLTILGQHASFEPQAIVTTKLDEAELVGAPLVAALRTSLPLAHFATGQRVPEDIEAASPERLASLLLGEQVIR
jgi:flagellar biosynthesis GTPase FlhF